jgi:tryptophanyl-tRNA synthetase
MCSALGYSGGTQSLSFFLKLIKMMGKGWDMRKRTLTGIKPTGQIHLGNYLGAIRPALELAKEYEAYYFIADYHALNGVKNPSEMQQYTYGVAAAWLACGLDPAHTTFYRQSDVPQVHELTTILMAFTAKGLLNRAHAYKAAVDQNTKEQREPDHHINMGLYTYPVLMAADILIAKADLVPVGYDQKQHLEMAKDIALSVNNAYKLPLLTLPEPHFSQQKSVVVGLDGRKMSKSYGNVIPLFCTEKELKKLVNKIITTSQGIEEPKDPDSCAIFALYKCFASEQQIADLAQQYRAPGMGWGVAKEALYTCLMAELAPVWERYTYWMSHPHEIDAILADGALRVGNIASEQLHQLKEAMGLR